jgi:tetratricopeptide (TPR) repeat protein
MHFHSFNFQPSFCSFFLLALDLTPGDTKALFRRGQAYESCGRTDEAFEDMRKVCEIDKTNKGLDFSSFFLEHLHLSYIPPFSSLSLYSAAMDAMKRLYEKRQVDLAAKMSQMKIKVKQQMEIVLRYKEDKDNKDAIEGNPLV